MQDPLKQGLKRNINIFSGSGVIIRMQDPLKQGLKLKISADTLVFPQFECKIH